jgi:predicted secreted hydrolase
MAFPADHGKHPAFQTEWWYITGNLDAADGRAFGYQFTIFRQGISRKPHSGNPWAVRDLYIFHGSLSDFSAGEYHSFHDISRAGPGLAGAAADTLDTYIKAQHLRRRPDGRLALTCRTTDYALELELTPTYPAPVLHGKKGLSRKGAKPGQASYYYSLPRLATAGTLIAPGGGKTLAGGDLTAATGGGTTPAPNETAAANGKQTADNEKTGGGKQTVTISVKAAVSGLSWYDHEFATNQLGPDQQGWDWVSLHLDDGTCLMLYQIRLTSGGTDPASSGTFIAADGNATHLQRTDFRFEPQNGTWTSKATGARYPLRRDIVIDRPVRLRLELEPRFEAQEQDARDTTGAAYWEGGVTVRGTAGDGRTIAGTGYMELTGYGRQLKIGTAE